MEQNGHGGKAKGTLGQSTVKHMVGGRVSEDTQRDWISAHGKSWRQDLGKKTESGEEKDSHPRHAPPKNVKHSQPLLGSQTQSH